MLTLFTIPKAFQGHNGVIQRNAIRSWTLLQPKCDVILMGDDEGTDQAAEELGVRHFPSLNRNEFGTPLLDHAFRLADSESKYPLLCYVNADIILMSDFIEAVRKVKQQSDWFLMTARRRNLAVEDLLTFDQCWEEELIADVSNHGRLEVPTGIDFWVYPRGLLDGIPPLAVGRMAFECWCLYKARARKADLIDATSAVISVHQNHDYSHFAGGQQAIGISVEAQRNRELVGGKPYFFTIRDRTHILTDNGLTRSRDGWRFWRAIRTAQVLPLSAPFPVRLLVKTLNIVINAGRDTLLVFVRRLRK